MFFQTQLSKLPHHRDGEDGVLHGSTLRAHFRPSTVLFSTLQATARRRETHHECHKAAIARPSPLVLIARPHDFDAGNVAVAQELALQHLLVHLGCQVADVQVGGEGVAIVKAAHAVVSRRPRGLKTRSALPPLPLALLSRLLLPGNRINRLAAVSSCRVSWASADVKLSCHVMKRSGSAGGWSCEYLLLTPC